MQNQKGNISVIVSFIIVVGIIILVVYALTHKSEAPSPQKMITEAPTTEQNINNKQEPKEQSASANKIKPMETNKRLLQNFTPVSSAPTLIKQDLKVGTGAEVQSGATVSVHYTGAVAATGEIFQSSKDFGTEPITFPLSGVIKGWTDGIPGMKVGGIRRLVIPSAQAYGATPPSGSGIPANADLVFDVELIAVK